MWAERRGDNRMEAEERQVSEKCSGSSNEQREESQVSQ